MTALETAIYNRTYYLANRERIIASNTRYIRANPERTARNRNGVATRDIPNRPEFCEICGRTSGSRKLSLDHCHATKKFRGWLCNSCNTILGMAGDNPDILKKIISYAERHQCQAF